MSALTVTSDPTPSDRLGSATGAVRIFLRIEAAGVFAGALGLYSFAGFSWPLFAILFLAPDLGMLGYLAGPRAGATAYNLAHTYAAPFVLAAGGYAFGGGSALTAALIWIAHIGFDRMLGYGLKYPTRFGDTHLGRVGR